MDWVTLATVALLVPFAAVWAAIIVCLAFGLAALALEPLARRRTRKE